MTLIRKIVPIFLLLCFVAIANVHANENTSVAKENISAAKANLDNSFNKILSLIKAPDFSDPVDRPKTLKNIEQEVKALFDFTEFSERASGQAWNKFSAQQKEEFTAAFANLLIYTYLSKIKNYNGEQVFYTDSRISSSGKFVEIGTVIELNDGRKVPVAYRMLEKNNSWFVYDVIVERISLVKNFRTQFHDILNTKNADELIVIIKTKAQEVQSAQE